MNCSSLIYSGPSQISRISYLHVISHFPVQHNREEGGFNPL